MPETTDPASEFARLCELLAQSSKERGDKFLATHFRVKAGSIEFFRIITCIHERIDEVATIVSAIPKLQKDIREQGKHSVKALHNAFSVDALVRPWADNGLVHLQPTNILPLKYLSGQVGELSSCLRISEEECNEALDCIADLQAWLREQQLVERDSIRQAIIEGLDALKFRLERFQWVGSGYALTSLKETVGAYLALERGDPTAANNPDAKAMLLKVAAALGFISKKITQAKDVADNGQFLLNVYDVCSTAIRHPAVAGALAYMAGQAT